MATSKKPASKKASSRKSKAKPAKKTAKTQAKKARSSRKKAKSPATQSPQEKKMDAVAAYLNEVFHLSCHSIEDGTEGPSPWQEILSKLIFLYNQEEGNQGHQIQGVVLNCTCEEKEHRLELPEFEHQCN